MKNEIFNSSESSEEALCEGEFEVLWYEHLIHEAHRDCQDEIGEIDDSVPFPACDFALNWKSNKTDRLELKATRKIARRDYIRDKCDTRY